MAFTAEEQKLYDFAKSALPRFLFQDQARAEEVMGAFVKIFDASRTQVVAFFEQALILQATGATPDWLNQHARDRGTSRQENETDSDLRFRLRNVEDALTRPLILAAAQAIIDAVPIVGTVAMAELKLDAAFFGDWTSDTGTGGTFTDQGGGNFKFEPDAGFQLPVTVDYEGSGWIGPPQLVISGASAGANDGTFPVTALDDDGVVFANAGVAGADPGCTWTLEKRDAEGNVIDGFSRAYFGRGYRFNSNRAMIIIILPFGCTEETRSSIFEMLRLKKGAGVQQIVECRANP